jgi:hypothetical protein
MTKSIYTDVSPEGNFEFLMIDEDTVTSKAVSILKGKPTADELQDLYNFLREYYGDI